MRQPKLTVMVLGLLMTILLVMTGCGGNSNGATEAESAVQAGSTNDDAEQAYVMRFGHASSAEEARHDTVVTFKEKLEAATNGRIRVDIYPNAQLGNNTNVMQGLQIGTIEAQIAPTAVMSGFDDLYSVIDLPFLWPDMDTALDVLNNSALGRQLVDRALTKDIYTVAFWGIGEKNIITKFPVKTRDDLKGHKMRVAEDQLLTEQFRSWGASAVPIGYDELYNALQQGIVEGYENTLEAWVAMKFNEVVKNFTYTRHGALIDGVFISKPWYDNLPADLQQAIDKVAQECVAIRQQQIQAAVDKAMAEIDTVAPDCVFYEISEEERNSFAETVGGVYEIFASRSADHKQYLEALQKVIEDYR